VIAANENLAKSAGAIGDLVGTGAVTDDIPEINDQIECGSGGEAGFQSFEIGVNVAQQQYAHESPDKLPIID
jgi:hypothetical protein